MRTKEQSFYRLIFPSIAAMLLFDFVVTYTGLAYGLSPVTSGDVAGYATLAIFTFVWLPYAVYKRWL